STTVKKATKIKGTGKTIALKVTCPDKVANYKNTLKVKVYNKKNNKLVKTLSKKATVKVTVLKVNSVETASTTGKYLVAYFNKSLKTLKVADVTVREKDTDIMKGVEKVTLASDGKSATIALVGDETMGTNEFVEKNKDYTFSVTQNGVTASTTFHVDAVLDNVTVTRTNAAKKTITVGDWTLNVPDSITVDYEEILGSTVTVWYNESAQITKLNNVDKKVVYGAFRVNKDTATQSAYFTDLATGEKYFTQDTENGKIFVTRLINRGSAAGTNAGQVVYNYAKVTDGAEYDYAKLVLNANGTVREAVVVDDMTNFLVDEVKDQTIVNGAEKQSLKDYSIVKDGKTVAITAIQKGDVVSFNSVAKFAEVYTNKQTGKLENVYAGKFGFGGKTYETKYAAYPNGYFYGASDDYMNALLKGGKDITVYFGRTGVVIYILGEQGEKETSTKTLYLIKGYAGNGNGAYKDKGVEVLEVKGYNVKSQKIETYLVPVASLETITLNARGEAKAAKYVIGKCIYDYNATKETFVENTDKAKVTSFGEGAATNDGKVKLNSDGADINLKDGIKAGAKVTLTFDKNNKIIGLTEDYCKDNTLTAPADITKLAEQVTLSAKSEINATTEISGQITADTKVYVIRTDKGTVNEQTFATLTEKVDASKTPNSYAWISNKVVTAIVLVGVNSDFVENAENGTPFHGVVASFTKNTDGTAKELQAYVQGELKTYTVFAESTKNTSLAVGSVVRITPSKKGDKINGLSSVGFTAENKAVKGFDATEGTVKIDDTKYQMVEAVNPTIVKLVKGTGATIEVTPYTFAELENCKYNVNVLQYATLAGVAEIIVVTDELVQGAASTTVSGNRAGAITVVTDDAISRKDDIIANNADALKFVPKEGKLVRTITVYVNGFTKGTFTGDKYTLPTGAEELKDGDKILIHVLYADEDKEELQYTVQKRKATTVDAKNEAPFTSASSSVTFKDQFGATISGPEQAMTNITCATSGVKLTVATDGKLTLTGADNPQANDSYEFKVLDKTVTIKCTAAADANTSAPATFSYEVK
ncbi:hypothetical protein SAMN02910358_02613, partial [Lachnospiraceae bacterium XBB1006]